MNLTDHFRRQFAYDAWANQEVLRTIRTTGASSERSVQLMSHILAAERVWLERLLQQSQSVPVWPKPDLDHCEKEAAELRRRWPEYLSSVGDLSQSIMYKNSKGESWASAIIDVLTHVVLHSAYHRGQIASHMRASGETPAYTDFIHGVRTGLVR